MRHFRGRTPQPLSAASAFGTSSSSSSGLNIATSPIGSFPSPLSPHSASSPPYAAFPPASPTTPVRFLPPGHHDSADASSGVSPPSLTAAHPFRVHSASLSVVELPDVRRDRTQPPQPPQQDKPAAITIAASPAPIRPQPSLQPQPHTLHSSAHAVVSAPEAFTSSKGTQFPTPTHQQTAAPGSSGASSSSSLPFSQQPNPFMRVNYLSILWLHLLTPLLALGRRKALTLDDIWEPVEADRTAVVHEQFERAWQRELELWQERQRRRPTDGSGPSLFRTLRRAFGWRLYVMLLLELGYYGFYSTVPFSMRALVEFIYAPSTSCSMWGIDCSWLYSFSLGVAVMLSSWCINHKFYHAYRAGSQMRSALMAAVYAKSLRLSSASRSSSTSGETINLMSNDCSRVFDAVTFFNTLFIAPLVIIVALGLLVWEIGIAAVAAVGLMLVVIPYQVWTARRTTAYRKSMLTCTDQRVKFMSEILQGIRICKLMSWEQAMGRRVGEMRRQELELLRPALLLKAMNLGILFVYPACVTFVTFVLYAFLGNEVVPSNVFIVMSFLTLIRFPVSLMPQAITFTSEARVGLARILRFLMQEELQSIAAAQLSSRQQQAQLQITISPAGGPPVSSPSALPPGSIVVRRGTFRWSKESAAPTLSDVSLSIGPGELIGVIGAVGCGKSSLLSALLGEMEQSTDSSVSIAGHVSYLAQKPWIRHQTVRENILFSLPLDESRYASCVADAALVSDFAILPAGDLTEIGEQGLNLSGGQKARVSLARALYRSALSEIFLLDDVFSAVDMSVGKHMFEQAVLRRLHGKTRILVLNSHLHFLQHCHRIIVITREEQQAAATQSQQQQQQQQATSGVIAACGPYAEIAARFPHLLSALEEKQKEEEAHTIFDPVAVKAATAAAAAAAAASAGNEGRRGPRARDHRPSDVVSFQQPDFSGSISCMPPHNVEDDEREDSSNDTQWEAARTAGEEEQTHSDQSQPAASSGTINAASHLKPPSSFFPAAAASLSPGTAGLPPEKAVGSLTSAESSGSGDVALSTCVDYFRAAGVRLGLLILGLIVFSYTAGQVCRILSDYWLVRWGADNNSPPPAHGTEWWVLTWAGWLTGAFFFALSRAWVYTDVNLRSSRALHDTIFARLMKAPINLYFDLTPAGRILNRFSKDLEQIDTLLPGYLHEFVLYSFQFVGTILLAAVVTVYFIPIIAPIVVFFLWIQTFFRNTSRELKRLEGVTRSPIFSCFGETLQGLATIRAYGLSAEFRRENERLVDRNSRVFLMGFLTERWLSIRLEVCSSLVVLAVALLTSNLRASISPTLAGLTLIYALQMTGLLQWTVRLSIQTENTMTAVERLQEFKQLPQEADYDTKPQLQLSTAWPERGEIAFRQAELRYRPELELVMRGISADVRAGEKVGICGRTGCGKCFARGTQLRLYTGDLIAVENIVGGEQLMGDDGTPRTVTPGSLTAPGSRDVLYTIRPQWEGAEPFTVNGDHILVLSNNARPWLTPEPVRAGRRQFWLANWYQLDTDNVLRVRQRQFDTEERAIAEVDRLTAGWAPVEWEVSVRNFLAAPSGVHSVCRLMAADAVTFVNPQLPGLAHVLGLVLGHVPTQAQVDWAAWYLGMWVTDGCADRASLSQGGPPQGQPDSHCEIMAELRRYQLLFGEPVTQQLDAMSTAGYPMSTFQFGQPGAYSGRTASVAHRLLQQYGLINDQHIPQAWICDTLDVRRRIFAGIMDGDRCRANGNGYELSAKQLRVAQGCRLLGGSLGLRSGRITVLTTTDKRTGLSCDSYRQVFSGPMHTVSQHIVCAHKKSPQPGAVDYRAPNADSRCYGFTIAQQAVGDFFGFAVHGGANRRFLLADFTITHNSTLMVALFRLVELSSGSISIDGVDIRDIGLERLRSSLSIIPQDAVLFSGNVRYNLDPCQQHSDAAIWQALDRVGLSATVRALPGGIDGVVAEGGDNFSHGQRQLICIARALLRQTRILILDEATASVDPASDRALQETLASSFSHCTVLTIAHRLHTIVHYDRVMVLSDGRIAEFDRPSVLLRRRSSLFYSMVSEGGDALLQQFLQLADAADDAREKKQLQTADAAFTRQAEAETAGVLPAEPLFPGRRKFLVTRVTFSRSAL